jgi:hypothetical protein
VARVPSENSGRDFAKELFDSWENECFRPFCEGHKIDVDECMDIWLNTLFHEGKCDDEDEVYKSQTYWYDVLTERVPSESNLMVEIFSTTELLTRLTRAMPFVTDQPWVGLTDGGVVEPSDIVCAFQGCDVPYVLREAEGGGHFLGPPCYMNGYMAKDIGYYGDLIDLV